jgi:hypothetical protein
MLARNLPGLESLKGLNLHISGEKSNESARLWPAFRRRFVP